MRLSKLPISLLVLAALPFNAAFAAVEPAPAARESGWHVLNGDYLGLSPIDGFTFEWQYFMVHDASGQFTGSIGYVLVDPRGRLGGISDTEGWARWRLPVSVMPSGASIAIAGRWADGSGFSNYERFTSGYEVSGASKNFVASDSERKLSAVLIEETKVSALGGSFRLRGETPDANWDFTVTPDWPDAGADQLERPFGPVSGSDVGFLPGESWNVHMQWPRTRVTGTMTNLRTGETITISGHGYRENSWGRWNFAVDGWAFAVVSDARSKVMWSWQSYHKSKQMDWLDVRFRDRGVTKSLRLYAKENQLRWRLKDWSFDQAARACIPHAVEVVGQDANYRIRASYDLTEAQQPMLSNATALTRIFVIMTHTPKIRGTIINRNTGDTVASFEAQGGGEFSTTRFVRDDLSPSDCERWGQRFTSEYEEIPGLFD